MTWRRRRHPPPDLNMCSGDCHSGDLECQPMTEQLAVTFLKAVAAVADSAVDLHELALAGQLAQVLRDELLLLERAQNDDEGLGLTGVKSGIAEDRRLSVGEAGSVDGQPAQVA